MRFVLLLLICASISPWTLCHKTKHKTSTDETTPHAIDLPPIVLRESHLFTSSGSLLLEGLSDFDNVEELRKSDLIVKLRYLVRDDDDDGDGKLTFIGKSTFEGDSRASKMPHMNAFLACTLVVFVMIFI